MRFVRVIDCTNLEHFGLTLIQVTQADRKTTGYVRAEQLFFWPNLYVENEKNDLVFCIDTPWVTPFRACYCGDLVFPIYSRDRKTDIGQIIRKKGAVYRYEISFPVDLEARMKAVLIAATLTIDYRLLFQGD